MSFDKKTTCENVHQDIGNGKFNLWLRRYGVFVACLIANTLFFYGMSLMLPIRFEENDDIAMLSIAAGITSGIPDPHLVFINFIWGYFISSLYTVYAEIEWYTISFAFLHIISLTLVVWKIAKDDKTVFQKVLFLLLFYVIEIQLILQFQFTTTAAITALAGVIIIDSKQYLQKMVGVLLLVIAGFIRLEVVLLVLLIVSPIFIRYLVGDKKIICRQNLMYIAASVIILGCFYYADSVFYNKDADWKYYKEYNKLRGSINDNPNAWQLLFNMPNDIEKVQFELFMRFFPDAQQYDLRKVKEIKATVKQVTFGEKMVNTLPALRPYQTLLLSILLLWLVAIINGFNNRQTRTILLLAVFSFLIALYYVGLDGFLKKRVMLSAILPFIWILYCCINKINQRRYIQWLLLLTVGFVSFYFTVDAISIRKRDENFRKTGFVEQVVLNKTFYAENENNFMVSFSDDFTSQFYPPFKVSQLLPKGRICGNGWSTHIPFNKGRYDSYMDIVENGRIFMRKQNLWRFIGRICFSVRQNYNVFLKARVEWESPHYCIVKLERVQGK